MLNPMQQLYEDTLQAVREQFRLARGMNEMARQEWLREVKVLVQHEMDALDLQANDNDGF